MKIYNSQLLSQRQRWWAALVLGLAASLIIALAYGWLCSQLLIELEILYIGIGWLIGMVIQKVGRGVQLRFSILGAALAALCFLISDAVQLFGLSIILAPASWWPAARLVIASLAALGVSPLLRLIFRAAGIFFAYQNSRYL